MGYKGTALFLDADMLVMGDIAELFALADPRYGVQVVKNARRFEWPSLMLFNCEKCTKLTPEYIDNPNNWPQSMDWAEVGELPSKWNFCIGYDKPKCPHEGLCTDFACANECKPKLLHYTAGIPIFEQTTKLGFVEEWKQAHKYANSSVSWDDLMGQSVHKGVVA